MIKQTILAVVVAVMLVATPAAAQVDQGQARKYRVHMSIFTSTSGSMWAYMRHARTMKFLRYITVCLQRRDNGRWRTRSCHRTSEIGRVDWALYKGRLYRLRVPATRHHYARTSWTFRGR